MKTFRQSSLILMNNFLWDLCVLSKYFILIIFENLINFFKNRFRFTEIIKMVQRVLKAQSFCSVINILHSYGICVKLIDIDMVQLTKHYIEISPPNPGPFLFQIHI